MTKVLLIKNKTLKFKAKKSRLMNTLMRNMVLMCFRAFVLNTAILAHADAGYFADNLQKTKEYIASDTLHYYINDYQDNVRSVVRQDGAEVESTVSATWCYGQNNNCHNESHIVRDIDCKIYDVNESLFFCRIDSLIELARQEIPDCNGWGDVHYRIMFIDYPEISFNSDRIEYFETGELISKCDFDNMIKCQAVSKPIRIWVVLFIIPNESGMFLHKNNYYFVLDDKYLDFITERSELTLEHRVFPTVFEYSVPPLPAITIIYNENGKMSLYSCECECPI